MAKRRRTRSIGNGARTGSLAGNLGTPSKDTAKPRFGRILTGGATAVGLISAAVGVFAELKKATPEFVEPNGGASSDPYEIPFRIRNPANFLTLRNIQITCRGQATMLSLEGEPSVSTTTTTDGPGLLKPGAISVVSCAGPRGIATPPPLDGRFVPADAVAIHATFEYEIDLFFWHPRRTATSAFLIWAKSASEHHWTLTDWPFPKGSECPVELCP